MSSRREKAFKTIPEQIEWLIETKNINIRDKEYANEYLICNSYYNFINSTKIHYINHTNNNTKQYVESEFEKWVTTFEKNIDLETKLMMLSLREEEIITNYIGNLVHENIRNSINEEFNTFVYKKLTNTKLVKAEYTKEDVKLAGYKVSVLGRTWAFVHEVMLKDKIEIIKKMSCLERNKLNDLLTINCNSYPELEAFRELRNCLAHNTPVNIYLTSPSSAKKRELRAKVINRLANKKGSGLKTKIDINVKDCKLYVHKKKIYIEKIYVIINYKQVLEGICKK